MSLIDNTINKLRKEQNSLIRKQASLIAKLQKMKHDRDVIGNKINDINTKIIKMNENKQVVLMAIAAGSETTENTGAPVKLITGIAPLMVLGVNPTKKELEALYGRELEKEPEYLSADEAGVKKLRVDFIVKTIVNEKLGCNDELVTRVSFFLEDKPAMTSGGDKVYMLNLYGESACIPLDNAKAGTVPDNMSWYNTTKMRPAFRGEVELVDFLKAYLGIPNRAFKDKVIADITQAEIQLENIKKYFTNGDISEFKTPVKFRMETNKVLLAGGVRQTDDNKQYQAWYLKKPLKYATTNFDYIKRDITDRQSQLNVDFGPTDLKFRIFNNEPTAFTAPVVDDDPFTQSMNSGIPANATSVAATDWFNQ